MTVQLVITEKSSQARDVRAAVGSRYGRVLAAEGHLLELREPEEVNPAWKRWSTELLRPDGLYGTKPASGGNKAAKLKAIRTALKTADRVWLATDCDREGQLIGQEILEHCCYRGEVFRVMFTAQDPETIRAAFRRARPNGEHARLYEAAVARRQADQIYNLSLTRTATVTLGRGSRGVIGVGRVKTPTLAIACRRELEIRAFVPQGYFEVAAAAQVEGGSFRMRHAPKERIVERAKAQTVVDAARDFEGPLRVRVEDKSRRPPRLHDLPSLQKLCSARFGWSASKTLAVAQELYDGEGKKILTYPRAGGALSAGERDRGRSEDRGGIAGGQILRVRPGAAEARDPQGTERVLPRQGAGECEPSRDRSQREQDRRAEGGLAATLAGREEAVRCGRAVLPGLGDAGLPLPADHGDTGRPGLRVQGHGPSADRGRLAGCLAGLAPGRGEGETAQVLPVLKDQETARLSDPEIEDKETRPPPRYREGTLIEAMQNAWRFVEDEALRERLKEAKGIGDAGHPWGRSSPG